MEAWAIIVGINQHPEGSLLTELFGAVDDAVDFAEWCLDPAGGAVAPERLYFWTFPAVDSVKVGPLLQAYLNKVTPWPHPISHLPQAPKKDRAPKSGEIKALVRQVGSKASFDAATKRRAYVHFAGHGVLFQKDGQGDTCFLVDDYVDDTGFVPCEEMSRALQTAGFSEVLMFLDCCQTFSNDGVTPTLFAIPGSKKTIAGTGWATEPGKLSFEFPDNPPKRGAFTKALTEGLRGHRGAGGSLSFAELADYVVKQVPVMLADKHQAPQFGTYPPSTPLVVVSSPATLQFRTVSIEFPPEHHGLTFNFKGPSPLPSPIVAGPGTLTFKVPVGKAYTLATPDFTIFRSLGPGTRASRRSKDEAPVILETSQDGKGRLIATGPAGFEIQVLDGEYNVLARGAERLDLTLASGVYVTRWIGPSAVRERVDYLRPIEKPLEVPYPDAARTSSLGPAALESVPAPDPSLIERDSAIVVLEQSDVPGMRGQLSDGLRLFNAEDVAMRSDSGEVEAVRHQTGDGSPSTGGWALRAYSVPAGDFRVRYVTVGGETLDQAVRALPGRRTVVVLRMAVGGSLIKSGAAYAPYFRRGVDAARTVIVTAPLADAGPPDTDQLALAEALLNGIRLGTDPLSAAAMKRITAPGADPLLALYAAWVIVLALAGEASPALDEPYPAADGETAFHDRWRQVAFGLLDGLPEALAQSPDATACRERLTAIAPAKPGLILFGIAQPPDNPLVRPAPAKPAPIDPPMLAAAWAWFVARDVNRTGEVDPRRAGVETRGPWVVRRASAGKGGAVESAGLSIAREAFSKHAILTLPPKKTGAAGLWEMLQTNAGFWVSGVGVYLISYAYLFVTEAIGKAGLAASSGVALALAAAVVVIIWVGWTGYREVRGRRPTPALSRQVREPDDPNKGRFGGRSEVRGVAIAAHFTDLPEVERVRVHLVLTARRPAKVRDGDPAVIYLHPTFAKNQVAVKFKHGVADVAITAWGGFTVGVWLPLQNIQLELDLAHAADAPRRITDW